MSAKKWVTINTFFISIVALVIVLIIGNISNNKVYDIALAIFGSALLGFIMSLTEYFTERKRAMEQFWIESLSILEKMRKIKYFYSDIPIDLLVDCLQEDDLRAFNKKNMGMIQSTEENKLESKNKLKEWLLENSNSSFTEDCLTDKNWDEYYKTYVDKYRKAFLDCIDSYCVVATIKLGSLDNAYGNLDFLVGNRKLRKKANDNIYDKLREYHNVILKGKYHFDLLQKGKGNFAVCINTMLKLNQMFFSETEETTEGGKVINVYQKLFDDVDENIEDFRSNIYIKVEAEIPERIPVCERFIISKNDDKNK